MSSKQTLPVSACLTVSVCVCVHCITTKCSFRLALEHVTHADLCDASPADCSDFGVCVHGVCDEVNNTCK